MDGTQDYAMIAGKCSKCSLGSEGIYILLSIVVTLLWFPVIRQVRQAADSLLSIMAAHLPNLASD